MPRNGSGTMSITNSFSPSTTISSSAVNANFADIGTELTNSLPRDGQAAMTGQMKAATGTAAAPGMSFGSDTNTGFYREAADTIGIAVGGAKVASVDSTGLITAAGEQYDAFPSGTVMLFVQTAAPTGWTKSTAHDDKALRVVSGTASSGGTTAFTSVLTSRTIAEANLPVHTHGVSGTTAAEGSHTHTFSATTSTDGNHSHTYLNHPNHTSSDGTGNPHPSGSSLSSATTDAGGSHNHGVSGTTAAGTSHTHSISFTSASTGSGTAMDFAIQYVDVIIATKD